MTSTKKSAPSSRARIRRITENADYEANTLFAIIDEAYVCHIAFNDGKDTHCIPTACWREAGYLYIHGSNGGRLTRQLMSGAQACVTITHIDGLVLARSAFNHSMNYRSAIIYGVFEAVTDPDQKKNALALLMDKIALGRQQEVRPGNAKELKATTVMRIDLSEAVCKTRKGDPVDDEEDMSIAAWAGVLPMRTQRLTPISASAATLATPAYVKAWDK